MAYVSNRLRHDTIKERRNSAPTKAKAGAEVIVVARASASLSLWRTSHRRSSCSRLSPPFISTMSGESSKRSNLIDVYVEMPSETLHEYPNRMYATTGHIKTYTLSSRAASKVRLSSKSLKSSNRASSSSKMSRSLSGSLRTRQGRKLSRARLLCQMASSCASRRPTGNSCLPLAKSSRWTRSKLSY